MPKQPLPNHITCIPTGVFPGFRRFPVPAESPHVKAWRCDLTALSQLFNLYFLACNDVVHVYQPSFPDQNLSSEPQLILHLPVSSQPGSGIDPEDAHSVTRILVDYLGSDEILLVACDDGDVIGYRVEEIHRAIDEQILSVNESRISPLRDGSVKSFLHRNVGASAWGLAIHRAARMIAISANTHKITMIAFALSDPLPPCRECLLSTSGPGSSEPVGIHVEEFRSSRAEDLAFKLSADTNIPAVSFSNNGDDPTGHWLFSCSIDGKMMVWNLHNPGVPSVVFQMGWCVNAQNPLSAPRLRPGECTCPDPGSVPHGVWGVLPLDTHSAYEISLTEREHMRIRKVEPYFEDVSKQRKAFTAKGRNHRSFKRGSSVSSLNSQEEADIMILDDESDADALSSEAESSRGDISHLDSNSDSDIVSTRAIEIERDPDKAVPDAISDGAAASLPTSGSSSSNSASPNVTAASESLLPGTSNQTQQQNTSNLPGLLHESMSLQNPNGEFHSLSPESLYQVMVGIHISPETSDTDDDEGDPFSFLPYLETTIPHIERLPARRAYCEISSPAPTRDQIPATRSQPCLVVTREEIYLLERPDPFVLLQPPNRIMCLRRPTWPGPCYFPRLAPHDRLCYLAQISELGIFIVASSAGRAAVCSLYFTQASARANPEYGFQLEYILPFHQSNDKDVLQVPNARLLGIAVAPVQGMSDVSSGMAATEQEQQQRPLQARRWRLLMYYTDHTVLSFELAKRSLGVTPELDDLVV